MELMLESLDNKDLVRRMHIVRSRGLEGDHGSWEEFMKFKFPNQQTRFLIPACQGKSVLIAFFLSLQKKDDIQLLQAWVLNPSRFLARLLSEQSTLSHSLLGLRRPIELSYYSRWHTLVKTSLAREDYPLDYFLSPPFEDWVVTGIGRNKSRSEYFENIDAIALCCDMVLSQDESESHSVRVVAINSDFKVIIDELFTPSHEAVVQHLESASHTLSLADIQEKLLKLLSVDTIMVGHSLKMDLQALKLDHTRVLDTSLVFKYDYSGEPPKEDNGYFETCVEFELIQPRRPSLDFLCKSILGYVEPPNTCLQKAEAAMKLALAVVEKGAKTSIPLTDEMLTSEKSTLFLPEEKKAIMEKTKRSKKFKTGLSSVLSTPAIETDSKRRSKKST